MDLPFIVDISYHFPNGKLLSVSFSRPINKPSLTIILGPSGSGKSTFLHCLVGIETPSSGFIRYGKSQWYDSEKKISLPPQERSASLLFQDYPLFPHLSVLNNIIFGIKNRSRKERLKQGRNWLERVQLKDKENYYPNELSGGEKQRVALAQMFASRPQLIILDEPFSALDQVMRTDLRIKVRAWIEEAKCTAIIVTHHLTEALALGDYLIILSAGKVLQKGSPMEIFNHPSHASVAKIMGVENLLPGVAIASEKGLITLDFGKGRLVGPGSARPGQKCFAAIRSEEVILKKRYLSGSSIRNHLSGVIQAIYPFGFQVEVIIDCGFLLRARIPQQLVQDLQLKLGTQITAVIKAPTIHMFSSSDLF
ncbi:MAG: ABC transporter ATP-binding protein [Nitrospiria bacterium]